MSDKYLGMTVNERLYVSGYMDEFELFVDKRDIEKVKAILKEIEVDEVSIKSILKEYNLV